MFAIQHLLTICAKGEIIMTKNRQVLRNKNLIDTIPLFTWGKDNFFFLKSFLQPYNNSINVYFRPVISYYIFALLKIII